MHENPHSALQYYYYSQFENNLINSVRGKKKSPLTHYLSFLSMIS